MSKKLSKAELRFSREAKGQIDRDAQQNEGGFFYFRAAARTPVFIPKRKKFKR